MKATEKTFNGLRISGFLALFLILALSGLSCYLIAGINETWSVITGIAGLCLLAVCLLGLMEIEPNNARVMLFFGKYKGTITDGNYIQSYSITLIKRCKDLLLSNFFITFAL